VEQAWAWPLIVDGIIVVATVAVVALRGRPGHRYAWMLVVVGAVVSVTVNGVQAVMPPGMVLPAGLAAAVCAMPPIVLLAITHLTVVLAKHDDEHNALSPPVGSVGVDREVSADHQDPVDEVVPEGSGLPPSPPQSSSTGVKTTQMAPAVGLAVAGQIADVLPSATGPVEVADGHDSEAPLAWPGGSMLDVPPGTMGMSEAELRRLLLGVAAEKPNEAVGGDRSRTWVVEEAMRLKAEGFSNREIADRLRVDPSTVGRWLKKHRQGDTDD
jgi:hypothetical protein